MCRRPAQSAHAVPRPDGPDRDRCALLFAVAIGAFVTSDIVFIKKLGLGAALAVLIDASIIRALLVPTLMELLDEWKR